MNRRHFLSLIVFTSCFDLDIKPKEKMSAEWFNSLLNTKSLPEELGLIDSDSSIGTNLANYSAGGGGANPASFTNSSGDLAVSRSTTVDYRSYLLYDTYGSTSLEKYVLTFEFTIGTITASSFGIGFGIQTTSAFGNRSIICQFNNSSGANGGKTSIIAGITTGTFGFTLQSSSVISSRTAGDSFRITITRDYLGITCLTENLTAGVSTTVSHNFSLVYTQTYNQSNTGKIAIYGIGGSFTVTGWSYSSTQRKNIDFCFVGDSIFYGAWAGSLANRFFNLIDSDSSKSFEMNTGSGDYTQAWLNKINELKRHNARYYILCTGNDKRFSVSQAIYQTNWTSVRNTLAASDISIGKTTAKIIHLVPFADSNYNFFEYQTWLTGGAFSSDIVIDLYAVSKNPGNSNMQATYDSGDGTHPNSTGHILIKDTIQSEFPTII